MFIIMLFKFITLLLVSTAVLGSPLKLYGPKLFPAGSRIVGGSQASVGEIPWQVSLQTSNGDLSCGGSIISNYWILTAAHCSVDINPNYYRVVSGTVRYAFGTMHSISQVVVHSGFNPNTLENDIAVWRVSPAFNYGVQTRDVVLPAQGATLPSGMLLTVSGWGTTSFQGSVSNTLLKVEVPLVSKQTCNNNYSSFGGLPANQICAGYTQGGKDSCQGDSGGPLVRNGVQYGVVSWGNGCAWAGYPGVYTEVSAYRNWIKTNTGV